jgi:hypothetical protein
MRLGGVSCDHLFCGQMQHGEARTGRPGWGRMKTAVLCQGGLAEKIVRHWGRETDYV